MIAYKKQRRKVDPVKQILARLDEKQSKSGLSLYSRDDIHKSVKSKEDVLPMVHPFKEANPVSNKSSQFFPDLSAARQKAHRRLNAGLQRTVDDSDHKAALYMQAKADKRLNLTFPPVKSQGMTGAVNQDRLGYAFSGWSESSSAGVENLRHNQYTSMNPFGYNRRTLAFQPTSLNYVVQWPETWPLKIMSLSKGTGVHHKKKTKPKPKVNRRVHFDSSPAPCVSPVEESKSKVKQLPTKTGAAPSKDQSKQVLPEMQNPETSVTAGTALSKSSVIEEPTHGKEDEEFLLAGQDLEANAPSHMLDVEGRHSSENQRVYSENSSLSESAYAIGFEDKVKTSEVPDDTNSQEAENMTKPSSVPPCTPTPTLDKTEDKSLENGEDSQEDKGGVGEEDSQSLLMGIVLQIAAEPTADYLQDI